MSNQENEISTPAARRARTGSKKLSAEDWVVISIVAFGFLGSVALLVYKVFPIVVAFFLATGVAAAVYRFLGGIRGATFVVGALKVSGTIAALIFLADFINSKLEKYVPPPTPPPQLISKNPLSEFTVSEILTGGDRTFTWQWAGENWIGQFEFEKTDQQEIPISDFFVEQVVKEPGGLRKTPVMKLSGAARIVVKDKHLELEIEVDKGGSKQKLVSRNLQMVPAFCGKVRYGQQGTGNLTLVKCGVL